MSRMFAVSHLEPSEMKISLRLRWTPSGAYAFSISVSMRKSYPCSGPYPMKVFSSPSSETASWNADRVAGGSGRVTSPIPRRMTFADGFAAANPSAKVIRLGIGDVTRPLPPAILSAFHDAVSELGDEKTFMGYGPEQGYDFLIDTLIEKAYAPLGVHHKRSEIFISDGSKAAGFTGVRCALTVVPEEVTANSPTGERVALNKLWNRRQTTKFNGVSYPVQRAAAAVYTEEGWRQTKTIVDYYMKNAKIIREGLAGARLTIHG